MFDVGWGKSEILIAPSGRAMNGYGMWGHRARNKQSPLLARAMWIADDEGRAVAICCLDLAMINNSITSAVSAALSDEMGGQFDPEGLVLTCTHTHSSPGGCSYEALYNVVTPGFVKEHLDQAVAAALAAIRAARDSAAPTELAVSSGPVPADETVAWNRSVDAYNRNPDVDTREANEAHLAIDRTMAVISATSDGNPAAFLSLFGVHATCLGNSLAAHDGDNKGYAAAAAERRLASSGSETPVAIFAQATAGDVSPHYHGPGDIARRKALKGDDEYAYARRNGQMQSDRAFAILEDGTAGTPIEGGVDSVCTYIDFTDVAVDPRHAGGRSDASTSEPCHGVAFFHGTRVDGPGMPSPLAKVTSMLARRLRKRRLSSLDVLPAPEREYFERIYDAQGPKDIMLEAGPKHILGKRIDSLKLPDFVDPSVGELKRQVRVGAIEESPMVPTVLPIQIVRLGNVAIVCCPGEFTTVAGQRLVSSVAARLEPCGVDQVLICSYSNDYMGYVTTNEEYQEQAYEGGHTIFGQWTLGAFQTCFDALADQLLVPAAQREHDRTRRPDPVPAHELALRSELPIP